MEQTYRFSKKVQIWTKEEKEAIMASVDSRSAEQVLKYISTSHEVSLYAKTERIFVPDATHPAGRRCTGFTVKIAVHVDGEIPSYLKRFKIGGGYVHRHGVPFSSCTITSWNTFCSWLKSQGWNYQGKVW